MKNLLLASGLAVSLAGGAHAQITGDVQQKGQVTAGHSASWAANGVIQDSGVPGGGVVPPFTTGDLLVANAQGRVVDAGVLSAPANAPTGIASNISAATYLSANLGPSGLNWLPYDFEFTNSYFRYAVPGTHGGVNVSLLAVINTPGSGTFGPGNADIPLAVSVSKNNYLTSSVDGEIDAVQITTRQGEKGDTGGLVVDAQKTKTGTAADSGGVAPFEVHGTFTDATGATTQYLASLCAFGEAAGGVSSSTGYGCDVEARAGAVWSAYHADTQHLGGALPNGGWKYVLDATTQRNVSNEYFRIQGDVVTGTQVAGDIIQGLSGNSKIIRTDSAGTLHIRNDADNKDLLTVTNGGNVTAVSGFLMSTGSYCYCGNFAATTGPIYPSGGNGVALGYGFQGNTEVDIFNTFFPASFANTGIAFIQQLTASTNRQLMFISNVGNVAAPTFNATTGFSANGTPGLASKSCLINTANTATGVTLTITEGLVTGTTIC